MTKRIQLTAAEIEAILTAAGDVDVGATFECLPESKQDAALKAFESGMEKLRLMLARKTSS
jgi:hypothetical protein